MWVKRLYGVQDSAHGKELYLAYACKLLDALKKGGMLASSGNLRGADLREAPFNENPPAGTLPKLPATVSFIGGII